eukprot:78370-Amphidinium_carterae.1
MAAWQTSSCPLPCSSLLHVRCCVHPAPKVFWVLPLLSTCTISSSFATAWRRPAMSASVLVTKELLKRHPPDQVTGWCYLVGSVGFLAAQRPGNPCTLALRLYGLTVSCVCVIEVFMLIGIMITRSSAAACMHHDTGKILSFEVRGRNTNYIQHVWSTCGGERLCHFQ